MTMRNWPSWLLCLAPLVLLACRPQTRDEPAQPFPANDSNATSEAAVLPRPEPALDRRALLIHAFEAASETSVGAGQKGQDELDGRTFEVRLRFACGEPVDRLARNATGWSFDERTRTLRVQAHSDLSLQDPRVTAVAGGRFEAAEGSWVPRPWQLQPACAAAPAAGTPTTATSESATWRVGLAQFFTSFDPRTNRRLGRAYEAVKRLDEGEKVPAGGFDLVLSGRLRRLDRGPVIACTAASPNVQPDCVISVNFDRVRIERADTSEMLAQWSSS